MQRVLVLGGGFAGLWSAVGAARKLDELGVGADQVEVTLVSSSPWHSIRVRNYEIDLDSTDTRDLSHRFAHVLRDAVTQRAGGDGEIDGDAHVSAALRLVEEAAKHDFLIRTQTLDEPGEDRGAVAL